MKWGELYWKNIFYAKKSLLLYEQFMVDKRTGYKMIYSQLMFHKYTEKDKVQSVIRFIDIHMYKKNS